MSTVTIRHIYKATCSKCGQVKGTSNHAMIVGWAELHNCDSVVYAAATVPASDDAIDEFNHIGDTMRRRISSHLSRDINEPYTGE